MSINMNYEWWIKNYDNLGKRGVSDFIFGPANCFLIFSEVSGIKGEIKTAISLISVTSFTKTFSKGSSFKVHGFSKSRYLSALAIKVQILDKFSLNWKVSKGRPIDS